MIGVNNRDLKTFNVNLDTTLKIREKLPDDILLISESGFSSKTDVNQVKGFANGLLIGEHFMRSKEIKSSVMQMREWCVK